MILADFTPLEGFLSAAMALIGIISFCLKWLRDKDRASIKTNAEMAKVNADHAAGNSGEIEKLWKVISEDKETIKGLRIDLLTAQRELLESRDDRHRLHRELEETKSAQRLLHEENRELLRNVNRLEEDNARLTAQNAQQESQLGQQASQIRSLEQKSGTRSTNGQ